MITLAAPKQVVSLFLASAVSLVGFGCAKTPHYEDMPFTRSDGTPYQIRGKTAIVGGLARKNGVTSANVQFVLKQPVTEDNIEEAQIAYVVSAGTDLEQVIKAVTGIGSTAAEIGMAGAALKAAQALAEGKQRDTAVSVQAAPLATAVSFSDQTQSQYQDQRQKTEASAQGGYATGGKSASFGGIANAATSTNVKATGGDAANVNAIQVNPSINTSSGAAAISPVRTDVNVGVGTGGNPSPH